MVPVCPAALRRLRLVTVPFRRATFYARHCFRTADNPSHRFRHLQLHFQRKYADLSHLHWSVMFCKDLAGAGQSIGSWDVVQKFHSRIFLCSNEWKTILSVGVNRCWSALSTRMLHAFLKSEHGWHTLHEFQWFVHILWALHIPYLLFPSGSPPFAFHFSCEIPFMVFMSFFGICCWVAAMNPHFVTLGSNQAVQGGESGNVSIEFFWWTPHQPQIWVGSICGRGGRFGTRRGCAAGRRSHRHELRDFVSFLALQFALQGSPTFFLVQITSDSPVRMRTTAPICATLLARRLKRIANMSNFFTSDSHVLGILWKLWGCCHFLPFVAICCLSAVFKTSNGGKPIDLAVWAMIREINQDWRKTPGCTFLYQRANLGRCFSCTQSIFILSSGALRISFHLQNFTRLSLQLHRSFHGCTRDNQRRCHFRLCPGKIPVLHDPLLSVPVVHNGSLRVVWVPGRARLLNARPFVQPMAQCQGVRMCWASLT